MELSLQFCISHNILKFHAKKAAYPTFLESTNTVLIKSTFERTELLKLLINAPMLLNLMKLDLMNIKTTHGKKIRKNQEFRIMPEITGAKSFSQYHHSV